MPSDSILIKEWDWYYRVGYDKKLEVKILKIL